MVGRFWECVGLVVVGSVRRGLTSSRHSARKGTASRSSGTQALIVLFFPPSHLTLKRGGGGVYYSTV